MAERFLLRLGDPLDGPVSWLTPGPEGDAPRVDSDSLLIAAQRAAGRRAVVLVPGTEVLLLRTALPSQNRQRMLKAVPYALEEQLVDDVEALHFAIGQREAGKEVPVAVVARKTMDEWLGRLSQAGIQPQWLIPESLAIPWRDAEWTLLVDQDRAHLRTGPQSGYSVDADNLEPILRLALTQAEEPPERIRVLAASTVSMDDIDLDEVEWVREGAPARSLMEVAGSMDPTQAINLLQGEFSAQEQLGKALRPWRPVAGLLICWLLLQTALVVADQVQLEAEAQALSEKIEGLFRSSFPDVRKIVNPRVQMQRRLDGLRQAPSGGAQGFVGMVAQVGPWLKKETAVEIQSVNYRDARLDVDLTISDLQRLDRLKQQLNDQTGFAVEIVSARSANNQVSARLRIRSAGV